MIVSAYLAVIRWWARERLQGEGWAADDCPQLLPQLLHPPPAKSLEARSEWRSRLAERKYIKILTVCII